MSQRLHERAARHSEAGTGSGLEMPYVALSRAGTRLSEPQAVWQFEHVAGRAAAGLDRAARLRFSVCATALAPVVHGFLGYFDCTLYGNVTMSTVAGRESADMLSWFPLYLPVRTPLYLCRGKAVLLSISRHTGLSNVWYEWAAHGDGDDKSGCSAPPFVHNRDGWAYKIALHVDEPTDLGNAVATAMRQLDGV